MIARFATILLVLAATALLAVGCGGDDGGNADDDAGKEPTEEPAVEDTDTASNDEASAPTADTELVLGVVGNELKFDPTELRAAAGPVTITLENTSTIQHNVAIEDADGTQLAEGELAGKGESSTVTVELEPGTYTYFCSPHKSSGMTGTLTVA